MPLCVLEVSNQFARLQARRFDAVVWWASSVEVYSAIFRLRRAKEITERQAQWSVARLKELGRSWRLVLPTNEVRELAERLLERHTLRAGDGLQLAAALVWCGGRPTRRVFLSGDERLSEAARAEGFAVMELPKE